MVALHITSICKNMHSATVAAADINIFSGVHSLEESKGMESICVDSLNGN
jgi:hypothetical protein